SCCLNRDGWRFSWPWSRRKIRMSAWRAPGSSSPPASASARTRSAASSRKGSTTNGRRCDRDRLGRLQRLFAPGGQTMDDARDRSQTLTAARPHDRAIRQRRRQSTAARTFEQPLKQVRTRVEQPAVNEQLARIEDVDDRRQSDGEMLQHFSQFLLCPYFTVAQERHDLLDGQFATQTRGNSCRQRRVRGHRLQTAVVTAAARLAMDVHGDMAQLTTQAAVTFE